MERYVLIRPGALGDALLAFPALGLLRRERPDAHVALVARADVLPLARASALANATCDWAGAAWAALFSDEPLAGSTDEARVVIQGAAVVAWLAHADGAVARNLAGWGARQFVIAPGRPPDDDILGAAPPREHVALLLARALASFGSAVPVTVEALVARMPPLRTSAADEVTAERAWQTLGLPSRRVVALHPGSGAAAKRWPPAGFAALAQRLVASGWRPLLVEGPADAIVTAALLAAMEPLAVEVPVARGLSVGALAALLRRCAGIAGNDSGVSHLAALARVPTLALFGPTDPTLWAPLGPCVRVIRAPSGDMAALEVGVVWERMEELLTERGQRAPD